MTDFIFLGSKITADQWLQPWNFKKRLTPWKENHNKSRQCLKKQGHCFADKGPNSQSYGFSSGHVWMWELDHKEGWAPKNWCFWTGCWIRLLRVRWIAGGSNQSILKEINPEYSLERLMLKWSSNPLATWCKELTHWKRPWYWEILKEGGEGDDRGRDSWMASLTQCTWIWASSRSWWM